jgi:hypothetical protein
MGYPNAIIEAARNLTAELKKTYPLITDQLYDSCGIPNPDGISFENRMQMGIYIELIKAGAFKP